MSSRGWGRSGAIEPGRSSLPPILTGGFCREFAAGREADAVILRVASPQTFMTTMLVFARIGSPQTAQMILVMPQAP